MGSGWHLLSVGSRPPPIQLPFLGVPVSACPPMPLTTPALYPWVDNGPSLPTETTRYPLKSVSERCLRPRPSPFPAKLLA